MEMFVFLAMLFCHVFDDYSLQGILAKMKCKSWWKKEAPNKMYRYDYIVALIMHAYSWSFMTLLPVAIFYEFNVPKRFVFILSINAILHAIIDHLKANEHYINLIIDQSFHVVQIIFAYLALMP